MGDYADEFTALGTGSNTDILPIDRVELETMADYLVPYIARSAFVSSDRPDVDLQLIFEQTLEMSSLWFRFQSDMDGWKSLAVSASRNGDSPSCEMYLGYFRRSALMRDTEIARLKRKMDRSVHISPV